MAEKASLKKNSNPRKRIAIVDELRGIAIFCMVFYHAFFMLWQLFDVKAAEKLFNVFEPIQPIFAALFIVLSGISSRLSRSNAKRGFRLLLVALGFSIATIFLLPKINIDGTEIYFGILHLLSVSMLIFALLRPVLDKIRPEYGVLICMLLYLLTAGISQGHIGLLNVFNFNLPRVLYETNYLFPLGFYNSDFYSMDYFPLLPNIFVFLTGTYLGVSVKQGKVPAWAYKQRIKFFDYIGRHTLIIYILHQPLIYGIVLFVKFIISLFK